jgi:hypothetical protein
MQIWGILYNGKGLKHYFGATALSLSGHVINLLPD